MALPPPPPVAPPARPASYWNDRFAHWQRPASDTEEAQIARTTRMIRDAISGSVVADVFAKGSYKQNTNVRANSDMDICVREDNIVTYSDWGERANNDELGLVYTPGGETNGQGFQRLRTDLDAALASQFGRGNVVMGNKAIAVHASQGTRIDADVVPAHRLWNIWPRSHWLYGSVPRYHEGIVLWAGPDGHMVINYPQQSYDNGVAKNNRTGRRYKKVVRILKRLRDELSFGLLVPRPSSYLIESLVWNVPDATFLVSDDMYTIVMAVLRWIAAATHADADANSLRETNNIKPLFCEAGVYKQPWTKWGANSFATRALYHLRAP